MAVFTPPGISAVPLVSVADTRTAPDTARVNPQGYNLMKYMQYPDAQTSDYVNVRPRGVNVWRLDITPFVPATCYFMSDPVPGVTFLGTIGYPYPDTLEPVNKAISTSYFPGGIGGVGSSGPGGLVEPAIAVLYEYLGGHAYTVSPTIAAELILVGLGAFVT